MKPREQDAGHFRHAAQDLLDQLKNSLQAQAVSLKTLPPIWSRAGRPGRPDARRGAARGDPNDNDTLRKFANAVLAAEPNAIGAVSF